MPGRKKVEPPEEQGAPAYMTMYTALMMLLLAFFIAIISMASSDTQRGGLQPGIGAIKNSFGIQGGLGLMPYIKMVRNLRAHYPDAEPAPDSPESERDLIGHTKKVMRRDLIMDEGFLSIKTIYRGVSLRINTPITFAAGSAALNPEAREFLQRMGVILNSFPEGLLTVRAYVAEAGMPDRDELLAAERAAAIVRYMQQQSGIAPWRMRAVGHASTRYLGEVRSEQSQSVVFLINKLLDDKTPAGIPAALYDSVNMEEL